MRAVLPAPLEKGDTVAIVAPASPVVEADVAPAAAYLKARGFDVVTGEALYGQDRFLAGSDAARAAQLNAAFADPGVKGIFTARGGYGSARVLPLLDWETVAAHPKLFVGFSDTTALQLGLFARSGLATVSSAVLKVDVTASGMDAVTEASLWSACAGSYDPLPVEPVKNDAGVEGRLLGGCLSLVTTLVGTPFMPEIGGALMYLEDVGESPYRIDRMLTHLRLAGVFDEAGAVLFGHFTRCTGSPEDGTVDQVLDDFAGLVPCPVYKNLPYGHGPSRRAMPVGLMGRVEAATLHVSVERET